MIEIRNMQEYTNVLMRIVELLKIKHPNSYQSQEKEMLFNALDEYNSIYQN